SPSQSLSHTQSYTMLRSVAVICALVAVSLAGAIPEKKEVQKIQLDDNCGAVSVGIQLGKKYTSNALSDAAHCQICLDLAILVDNYLDCAEGMIQSKANQWCDDNFANLYYKDVCFDLVNQIADELEKATDDAIVPTDVCTKIMKEPCPAQ
ncbi:hypothetical protein PENTCL1PPCAC_25505, partial [Pristionchus entomophagus]